MRYALWILAGSLWLAACAPAQGQILETATLSPDTAVTSPPAGGTPTGPLGNPFAPRPADDNFNRGNVFLNEMDLLIRESYPPQIALVLSGDLPTPCHQLRVQAGEPDAGNRIDVEVYTVVDPDLACIQVLEPFEATVDLGTFPGGHYSVWVNGELAGEFDS